MNAVLKDQKSVLKHAQGTGQIKVLPQETELTNQKGEEKSRDATQFAMRKNTEIAKIKKIALKSSN